jgi:hypothetical protein
MNRKIIDIWSFIHFLFAYFITKIFIYSGIGLNIIFYIIIIYELLEHLFIGNSIFNWIKRERTEVIENSLFDIIFGILGFLVAITI